MIIDIPDHMIDSVNEYIRRNDKLAQKNANIKTVSEKILEDLVHNAGLSNVPASNLLPNKVDVQIWRNQIEWVKFYNSNYSAINYSIDSKDLRLLDDPVYLLWHIRWAMAWINICETIFQVYVIPYHKWHSEWLAMWGKIDLINDGAICDWRALLKSR